MRNGELSAEIQEAFPRCVGTLSDDFIESNPDLSFLDAGHDLQVSVPAYMSWCARNGDRPAELVHDYTLRALAEFGRSKNREGTHLNFKHTCSSAQRHVVERYLRWCLDPALLLDAEQVQRSLKHWSQANS